MPSGGDWCLERIGAVYATGTNRLVVRSNTFVRVDGNGVFLDAYHRNATLEGNEFLYVGGSAMAAWGHTESVKGVPVPPGKVGGDARWRRTSAVPARGSPGVPDPRALTGAAATSRASRR